MTSCSTTGIHPLKFKDFCVDELCVTECTEKEFKDLDKKQLHDGVVIYTEGGDLFAVHKERAYPEQGSLTLGLVGMMPNNKDFDDLEIKDSTYLEIMDAEEGESPDFITFSSMLRFDDREQALAAFETYQDRMTEDFDFNFDKFNSWEYDFDEDAYEGHFIIAMNEQEIKDQINDTLDRMKKRYGGEIGGIREAVDEYCDKGFRLVAFTYLKGRTLTITYFITNKNETGYIADIGEYFGISGLDKKVSSDELLAKLAENEFGSIAIHYD